MKEVVRQAGRTVRKAIRSTPGTVRLCALLLVAGVAVGICAYLSLGIAPWVVYVSLSR